MILERRENWASKPTRRTVCDAARLARLLATTVVNAAESSSEELVH